MSRKRYLLCTHFCGPCKDEVHIGGPQPCPPLLPSLGALIRALAQPSHPQDHLGSSWQSLGPCWGCSDEDKASPANPQLHQAGTLHLFLTPSTSPPTYTLIKLPRGRGGPTTLPQCQPKGSPLPTAWPGKAVLSHCRLHMDCPLWGPVKTHQEVASSVEPLSTPAAPALPPCCISSGFSSCGLAPSPACVPAGWTLLCAKSRTAQSEPPCRPLCLRAWGRRLPAWHHCRILATPSASTQGGHGTPTEGCPEALQACRSGQGRSNC